MAKTRARTGFTPKLISIAVASCFVTGVAFANPTGPTVVNGTASFHQQGNLLQITNSPSAIIHWQSFSIGASEITRFLQQSASSAVLNRVITQNPSSILGALQSNGRVFLINPNGILFGAGAQIDVAGLVASTLNLSNADFLAGRLRFTEVPGAGGVINQGNITAAAGGQVYLVGSSVTNSGIITSPKGEVVLAAGNSVELVNPGTPNLRVEISAPDNEARNLGHIVADAGRVGIYAGLINHAGTIRADSAVSEGGRIVLKATKSATLENSSILSVQGNGGGEIVVLAGETVQVGGRLDASAPNGGDGGFIETSAHNVYVESGTVVTTAAPQGKTGTWLIDPTDFTVAAGGGAQTASGIGADTLSDDLCCTDVVISTSPAGGEPGDIFVNAAVTWSSGKDLTLTAHRNVNVNVDGAITSTGGGTVALNAGWNGTSPAATPVVTAGTGNVVVNAPISVTDDTFSGRDATIKLTAGGTIAVNKNITAIGGNSFEGPGGSAFITLNAGTDITVSSSTITATGGNGGNGAAGGNATATLIAGGNISLASSINVFGGGGGGGSSGGTVGGNGGNGGAATAMLTAGGNISLTSSSINVGAGGGGGGGFGSSTGGNGGNGGTATAALSAGGNINLTLSNIKVGGGGGGGGAGGSASGGNGGAGVGGGGGMGGSGSADLSGRGGSGGTAMATLSAGGSISLSSSSIEVGGGWGGDGGSGGSNGVGGNGGAGGAATASLTAGGTISLNPTTIDVIAGLGGDGGDGGEGGGNGAVGGAASVSLSAGSGIVLTSSQIFADGADGGEGGFGGFGSPSGMDAGGGNSFVTFTTGGNVALGSSVNAEGGSGSPDGTGRIDLTFLNSSGTYSVNGVTGAIAIGPDGFFVDGPPAQLDVNFFVHMPSAEVPVPDTCALLASAGMCGGGEGSNPLGAPPLEEPGLGAPDDEKKKQLPICGAGTGR